MGGGNSPSRGESENVLFPRGDVFHRQLLERASHSVFRPVEQLSKHGDTTNSSASPAPTPPCGADY